MSSFNGPFQGPVGPVPLRERQALCEAVVGAVEWNPREHWGYCTCPGVNLHTNHNGRRDCRVYADETPGAGRAGGTLPPGVTCLHTSCRSAVEEASHRIRSLIGKAKVEAGRAMSGQKTGVGGLNRTMVRDGERAATGPGGPPKVAQPAPQRTGRTPFFRLPDGAEAGFRTPRTAIARPYALHAHTGAHTPVHAHVPGGSSELPSEPSTRQPATPATPAPSVAKPADIAAEPPAEKPGVLTLCLKGEPPARVEWDGHTLKRKFEFKSRHE